MRDPNFKIYYERCVTEEKDSASDEGDILAN